MIEAVTKAMRRTAAAAVAAVPLVAPLGAGVVSAAEIQWRAVANQQTGGQWPGKWLWLKDELPKQTGGRLAINLTTLPELGLTGFELVRVLKANLVDIADVVTGYVSGDVPLIEGAQLPGIYRDYEQARKGYGQWLPKVVQTREKVMGGRAISSFAFATLYLWTKAPINSLADLKGKKIRIFAKAQSDYLGKLGAEPVSIPFAELYTALERGTVDGVVTGPDAAEGLKLWEVVKYVTDLQLGVGAGFIVVSQKSWDALPADLRGKLDALGSELTKRGWDVGAADTKKGLDASLKNGIKATIPAKEEWRAALNAAAKEVVVPEWAKRAGAEGPKVFNEVLGPVVGFTIQ